jgi:ubiquinol-cytochrome c reductase cytochrome c1 subunit
MCHIVRYVVAGMALSISFITGAANAAVTLEHAHYRFDADTLAQGAKLFAEHCLSCHSARYVRYNRLVPDLGMTKSSIEHAIMLPGGANFERGMISVMRPEDAKRWFGTAAPDLSLEVRYRGADWVYTYLHSFYWDPRRPGGWNNRLFPNVAMPNILARLGGIQDRQGRTLVPGALTPGEFDRMVADITAWLRYTSDPSKIQRTALGPYVIGFLVLFAVLAYLLKRTYWRDVER